MEGFGVATARSTTAEIAASRQIQEAQNQLVAAKRFPRDESAARNRILTACQRKRLAEQAEYEYSRGTSKVSGVSVRLAETIAQNWGNLDFGFVELEQGVKESQVMAYCWDLETNTRQTKVFTVKHIRETKKGSYPLTGSRDIYELVANQASRRVRACILGIIPGDIIEEAVEQCRKTLIESEKEPLRDLIHGVLITAEKDYKVPKESLERYIGCKAEAFSMNDLIRLKRVFNSIKDGMAKTEEIFEIPGTEKKEAEDAFAGKEKKDKKNEENPAGVQQQLDLGDDADEAK